MKIHSHSMFGTNHSWSVSLKSLLAPLILKGHDVTFQSINGWDNFPEEWKNKIVDRDDNDLEIAYTSPKHFARRFKHDSKVKMAIYNYETDLLPSVWLDAYKHVDAILPSSSFSKKVFTKNGWPDEKCHVVHHGVNIKQFDNKDKFKLQTNKTFKFLNISIPHYRKNIDLLVEAYYQAFSHADDVCLVIKTDTAAPPGRRRFAFECDPIQQIKKVQSKMIGRKLFPAIDIVNQQLPSIVPLFNSCDVLISASSSEGFGMPLLEGLAADKIVIAPRATGQLDFLNDKNSLLVNVDVVNATPQYQYWAATPGALTFKPKVKELSSAMLNAYKNHSGLKSSFQEERLKTLDAFTWEKAADKVISIYDSIKSI